MKIRTVEWDNERPGVNSCIDMPDDDPTAEQVEACPHASSPASDLIAHLVNGTGSEDPDDKQFIMAVFYKGASTSKQALSNSFMVKEAYGVEENGMQYLCLIMYKNNGRRMKTIANVLYENGILPNTIIPELIQGPDGEHHISVFKLSRVTNDPVMTMLKKPNPTKWNWYSTTKAS